MTQYITSSNEAEIRAFQARVDSVFGYPICYCGRYHGQICEICGNPCEKPKQIGSGIFPRNSCTAIRTLTQENIKIHPSGTLWAYPVEQTERNIFTAQERTRIVNLSSDWEIRDSSEDERDPRSSGSVDERER